MALARLKLRENTTHGLHDETDQGMSRLPWSLLLCPPKYIDGGMSEPIGETQVHGHKPIQISPMLGICWQELPPVTMPVRFLRIQGSMHIGTSGSRLPRNRSI